MSQLLGHWREAERFLADWPTTDPLGPCYAQAIAQISEALAEVATLDDLISRYGARPDPTGDPQTDTVQVVCTRFAPEGRHLLPHTVENAAYARRAKQLLSTWWTQDWQPPAPPLPDPVPAAPAVAEHQSAPKKRTRRKPIATQASNDP